MLNFQCLASVPDLFVPTCRYPHPCSRNLERSWTSGRSNWHGIVTYAAELSESRACISQRSLNLPKWTRASLVRISSARSCLMSRPNCRRPARVLRLLATNHIFREVAPDVFAHNRLSSILDTGKSVEELVKEYVSTVRQGLIID